MPDPRYFERPTLFRTAPFIAVAMIACMLPSAHAQGDGAYGRFDGSLHVDLAVGAAVHDNGDSAATWNARLRYVDSAGIVLRGVHSLGDDTYPTRLFAGVELRPLFPARFLIDSEFGVEWFDLLVDSVGFELGASFIGPFDTEPRLTIAFGIDVPIVTPSMWNHGVFIHLAAEHVVMDQGFWSFSALFDLRFVFASAVGLHDPR